jgi:hypothetical protein
MKRFFLKSVACLLLAVVLAGVLPNNLSFSTPHKEAMAQVGVGAVAAGANGLARLFSALSSASTTSAIGKAVDLVNGIASLPEFFAKFTILNYISIVLQSYVGLAALVFDLAVRISIQGISYFFSNNGPVLGTWQLIRDLFNISFIFILLYIAIAQILGSLGVKAKTTLVNVIISAIFINFSMFVAKIIIDVGNLAALGLYQNILASKIIAGNPAAMLGNLSCIAYPMSCMIMQGLGLQQFFDILLSTNQVAVNMQQILQIVLLGITLWAFVWGSFILIGRLVSLIFLVAVSPIAFVGNTLPWLSDKSSEWWSSFIGQVSVAPLLMFTLFIVSKMVEQKETIIYNLDGGIGSNLGSLIYSCLIIGILLAGLKMTKKMSGVVGDTVDKIIKTTAKIAGLVAVVAATVATAGAAGAVLGGAAVAGEAGAEGAIATTGARVAAGGVARSLPAGAARVGAPLSSVVATRAAGSAGGMATTATRVAGSTGGATGTATSKLGFSSFHQGGLKGAGDAIKKLFTGELGEHPNALVSVTSNWVRGKVMKGVKDITGGKVDLKATESWLKRSRTESEARINKWLESQGPKKEIEEKKDLEQTRDNVYAHAESTMKHSTKSEDKEVREKLESAQKNLEQAKKDVETGKGHGLEEVHMKPLRENVMRQESELKSAQTAYNDRRNVVAVGVAGNMGINLTSLLKNIESADKKIHDATERGFEAMVDLGKRSYIATRQTNKNLEKIIRTAQSKKDGRISAGAINVKVIKDMLEKGGLKVDEEEPAAEEKSAKKEEGTKKP